MKPGCNVQGLVVVLLGTAALVYNAFGQASPPPGDPEPGQPPPEQASPGEQEPSQADEPGQADPESVPTPRQPSPEDIIRQFQQQRPEVVPVLPTGRDDETITRRGEGELVARGRPPGRLPDGAMLVDRAGRVVQEGPWWVFNFESDSNSYPEPPMKLLPNQALERMVRESRSGLDAVVFVVTGEVTDFRGENYLLPRKVLRKRNLGNLKK